MFDDGSALGQVPSQLIRVGKDHITIDFNPQKLKGMLRKYYCYPNDHRKQIWSILLNLPRNKEAYDELLSKSKLPQATAIVEKKKCKKRIIPIINALMHWHAPLINCEWLPVFVQKLDNSFGSDPLFCFEVTITFLVNYFQEWITDLPGPPPDILSRIDAIFTNYDSILRDGLGSGLVAWPAYRSCFAETLYDRSWLEIMDIILSSNPQFIEFIIVAWLIFNSKQVRIDHQTFNKTLRPIDTESVVKLALRILAFTPKNLLSHAWFHPLDQGSYPVLEASSDSVALRTLQSDNDKLILLQQQLREERAKANAAEATKRRREETYNAISQLVDSRDNQERIETAKAAGNLSQLMKRLRLEGQRLKQCEENEFLDNWIHEWRKGANMSLTKLPFRAEDDDDQIVNQQGIKMQSMSNLRQSDIMVRDSRRVAISRGNHARGEIEAHLHKTQIDNEISDLNQNPNLLLKLNKL